MRKTHSNPGQCSINFVVQAGLKLKEVFLSLPPTCFNHRFDPAHTARGFLYITTERWSFLGDKSYLPKVLYSLLTPTHSLFCFQETGVMPCPLLVGGRTLPMLEGKPPERPSSRCRDPPREEEREKKKKKHKKRSRTRSRSPKYHSSSKPRSRSHSKAKHSLPSAYRTVRRSRWVCWYSCSLAPSCPTL